MRDYKTTEMILFPIGYFILSILFFIIDRNFISVWLGINVGLAVIPMILITLVYMRLEKNEFSFDWLAILLLIVFVFFFPNTFYVVTDLIHIDQDDYYTSTMTSSMEYMRSIEDYIFLFHVLITVAIGVYAGVKSMLRFSVIFDKKYDTATKGTMLFVLIFLSSIGIYIGRFLRFFSWEILNPFRIINEFIQSFDVFTVMFIGLFIVIQFTLYFGYRYFYEKEPF